MKTHERLDWLRIAHHQKTTPKRFWSWIDANWDVQRIIDHLEKKESPHPLWSLDDAHHYEDKCKNEGVSFVFWCDEAFPKNLKNIDSCPIYLEYKGDLSILSRPLIAIVGGRNSSFAAREFTKHIAFELSRVGIGVVSGLAHGIDTAAHMGSLEFGTVAVMAGGINIMYPKENTVLYQNIGEKGLLLSEMSLSHPIMKSLFPRRNRLIAGLSIGTLLIEAGLPSGSLITAEFAKDFNRDVFAVPSSPFDERARGCHHLIKQGAILVESAKDILDYYRFEVKATAPQKESSKQSIQTYPVLDSKEGLKEKLLKFLSYTPISIDDVIERFGNVQHMLQVISVLELEDKIVKTPQGISLSPSNQS